MIYIPAGNIKLESKEYLPKEDGCGEKNGRGRSIRKGQLAPRESEARGGYHKHTLYTRSEIKDLAKGRDKKGGGAQESPLE